VLDDRFEDRDRIFRPSFQYSTVHFESGRSRDCSTLRRSTSQQSNGSSLKHDAWDLNYLDCNHAAPESSYLDPPNTGRQKQHRGWSWPGWMMMRFFVSRIETRGTAALSYETHDLIRCLCDTIKEQLQPNDLEEGRRGVCTWSSVLACESKVIVPASY
jgi:hypothetical protein